MSNRLPVLAAEVSTLHREITALTARATEKAIAVGERLAEAKKIVGHGGWSDWLSEAGIPPRTARRYLALHRVGMKPATVADLGGVAAAASFASKLRLPKQGEAFCVIGEGRLAAVWPCADGYHVGGLDALRGTVETSSKPMGTERGVWASLWIVLDHMGPGADALEIFLDQGAANTVDFFTEMTRDQHANRSGFRLPLSRGQHEKA